MPFVRNGFGQKRRTLTTMDTTRMVAMFLAACFFLFLGLAGVLAPSENLDQEDATAATTQHATSNHTSSCAHAQEKDLLEDLERTVRDSQYCVPQYADCLVAEQASCRANLALCLLPFSEIDISAESRLLPLKEENKASIPECDSDSRKTYSEILALKAHVEAQRSCAIEHSKCSETDNYECLRRLGTCVSKVAKSHPFRPPAGDVMVSN